MAETLGMLCDKITIVKLKQYHTNDEQKLESLKHQDQQLQEEIDQYIIDAINGKIPLEKLGFSANKIFKQEGNNTRKIEGKIGEIIAELATVIVCFGTNKRKYMNLKMYLFMKKIL